MDGWLNGSGRCWWFSYSFIIRQMVWQLLLPWHLLTCDSLFNYYHDRCHIYHVNWIRGETSLPQPVELPVTALTWILWNLINNLKKKDTFSANRICHQSPAISALDRRLMLSVRRENHVEMSVNRRKIEINIRKIWKIYSNCYTNIYFPMSGRRK